MLRLVGQKDIGPKELKFSDLPQCAKVKMKIISGCVHSPLSGPTYYMDILFPPSQRGRVIFVWQGS